MLYPSLCLVSPAMTEKSAPAMARIVPPFSEYGLNCRCWGRSKEPSGMVGGVGRVDDGKQLALEAGMARTKAGVADEARLGREREAYIRSGDGAASVRVDATVAHLGGGV